MTSANLTNKKRSSLTVFLMRHGERLDEALERQCRPVPRELRMDPPLTPEGHKQAEESFARLTAALQADGRKRKIAVVCSPTRRTIGTSLMLATCDLARADGGDLVEWAFQSPADAKNAAEQKQKHPIPVTVLNGLGSCAARVAWCGGAEPAVEAGLLPCADFAKNDGSEQCPVAVELAQMHQCCSDSSLEEEEVQPVQYYKLEREPLNTTANGRAACPLSLLPLSPPVTPFGFCESNNETASMETAKVPEHCQQRGNESFLQAVDRAVLIAESAGCDTLIVVTHREGIRELLGRWGSNGFDRFPRHLNYCCLASFVVNTYEQDHACRWSFHGVFDYEDFDVDSVPSKERWTQMMKKKLTSGGGKIPKPKLRSACKKEKKESV